MRNRMWTVFSYELWRNLRRKAFLFTTFGVPLIGLLLTLGVQVLGSGAFAPPERTGVPGLNLPDFDMDGIQRPGYVDLSGRFAEAGELSEVFTVYPDVASARAALDAGTIDVYYVIAADYLESGAVELVMPRLDISRVNEDPIRRLLLNELARDVRQPDLFDRLVTPSRLEEINLQSALPDDEAQDEDSAMFVVYIFAFALLMSMFVTNGYLMQSVIEEKETRLIEILVSSLRPMELLTGKILALGVLGLLQMIVWVAGILLTARIGGADIIAGRAIALFTNLYIPPGLIPLLLIYFVLAYLMFAGAYSIVGALSNSMREGPQYAALFTLPAVIPMWFASLFASAPDGPIPTALSLFPITAPLAMIQRVAITTVPAWQIIVSITLLTLTVIGVMWLAGRVFRVQTLLAGQPPRLRDFPRLLRG